MFRYCRVYDFYLLTLSLIMLFMKDSRLEGKLLKNSINIENCGQIINGRKEYMTFGK